MNKVGVDTNIFIYTLDNSSPHHKKCYDFLQYSDSELFTTSKNISEYFAVCTKIGIDWVKMIEFYNEIKLNTTILFPNDLSLLCFENLTDKYRSKGNRIFDFEIISVLNTNAINKIATINFEDFKNISEIELIDFLK